MSTLGKKHTPETKAKLSEAAKQRKHSAETKAKISTTLRGKVLTEEHRAKLKAALLDQKYAPEIGRIVSVKTLRKIRETG